jgi:hypothetical protein
MPSALHGRASPGVWHVPPVRERDGVPGVPCSHATLAGIPAGLYSAAETARFRPLVAPLRVTPGPDQEAKARDGERRLDTMAARQHAAALDVRDTDMPPS